MRHPKFVEWWRHKGVDPQAWWINQARKTAEIDGAMGKRQLDRIEAQRQAQILSYRRAYIEIAVIVVVVIAGIAAIWTR